MSEHANTPEAGETTIPSGGAARVPSGGAPADVHEEVLFAAQDAKVREVADFVAGLYGDAEMFSPSHRLVARDVAARIRREFLPA